jgi:hypothetical protein
MTYYPPEWPDHWKIEAPVIRRASPWPWPSEYEAELGRWNPYGGDPARMPPGLTLIAPESSKATRNAIAKLGRYFQREFGYDFPPYAADTAQPGDDESRTFAWLTHSDERLAYGACGFSLGDPHPSVPWSLDWVWLHPFARRHGLLSLAWPFFCARFGPIRVQPPWSPAMRAFLAGQPKVDQGDGRPLFSARPLEDCYDS